MKFGTRQRGILLIGLLMAALSAAAWVREGDKVGESEMVEAPVRHARPANATLERKEQMVERVHLEKLRAHPSGDRTDDAFAPRSWRKPAPKALAVANIVVAPPPPGAPPLPFAYMGRLFSDEKREIYLTQGERTLIVHEGDMIDAIYRVDNLSDAGLTFIHLPTGIQQNLPIGEPQ